RRVAEEGVPGPEGAAVRIETDGPSRAQKRSKVHYRHRFIELKYFQQRHATTGEAFGVGGRGESIEHEYVAVGGESVAADFRERPGDAIEALEDSALAVPRPQLPDAIIDPPHASAQM